MTSCVIPLLGWECAGSLTFCRQAAVCMLPLAPIDPQWMADDRARLGEQRRGGNQGAQYNQRWFHNVDKLPLMHCDTQRVILLLTSLHCCSSRGRAPLIFTQVDAVHILRPLVVCLISKSVQIQLGQLVPIGDLIGGMWWWKQCVLLAANQVSQKCCCFQLA